MVFMCKIVPQRTFFIWKVVRRYNKWMVSTAKKQLTYPEDSPEDNGTYADDGSTEDNIDTEDSSGKARFRYRGQWWRGQW